MAAYSLSDGIESLNVDGNGLALERRHAPVNDEFGAQHESGFRRRQVKRSGGFSLPPRA
jgi:hypothetical protein